MVAAGLVAATGWAVLIVAIWAAGRLVLDGQLARPGRAGHLAAMVAVAAVLIARLLPEAVALAAPLRTCRWFGCPPRRTTWAAAVTAFRAVVKARMTAMRAARTGHAPTQLRLLVVDELDSFSAMMGRAGTAGKNAVADLRDTLRLARQCGCHVVVAAQQPDVGIFGKSGDREQATHRPMNIY